MLFLYNNCHKSANLSYSNLAYEHLNMNKMTLKIHEFITKNIEGKKVLIFFVLANIVYSIMLLVTIPKVMIFSNGMKLPDMLPTGYSPNYINKLLSNLGEEGRNTYLYRQIPVDMVYPLLFSVSWCLVIAWFLNKLGKLNGSLIYLCLLPILAGFFDYLENTGMIVILNRYPDNPDYLSMLTNVFTILKSLLTTIYFIALIIIMVIFVLKKLK